MKSDFYKFLNKEIGDKTGPVPAPLIIFGLPILILLIILWLIISLIKDIITGRRYKDAGGQPKNKGKKKAKSEVKKENRLESKPDPKIQSKQTDLENKNPAQAEHNSGDQTDIQSEVKLFSESDLQAEANEGPNSDKNAE